MTYANVIADSISVDNVRVTTMEVRFHRFVLAEFNTHRVFSRNSASSRAIPVAKQIERVKQDPAIPVAWPAEQKGMQGGDEVESAEELGAEWEGLAEQAAFDAGFIAQEYGLHKSVVNRLLEPFMWHTVVVTSTAWANFFAQRCSPLAQPEIRVAAEKMREAYGWSRPQQLSEGEWHLPYIGPQDWQEMSNSGRYRLGESMYPGMVRISAARCARTSYLTQNGKRDLEEDLSLYERLVSAKPEPHWSPLEHVATPWVLNRQNGFLSWGNEPLAHGRAVPLNDLPRVGNLLGWRSLRIEEEARRGARTYS